MLTMKKIGLLVFVARFLLLVLPVMAGAGMTVSAPSGGTHDNASEIRAGKELYTLCSGCHSPSYHRTGPRHCGLLGRVAGKVSGFEFTQVMRDSGIVWDRQSLDEFLKAPFKRLPGTSMGFSGMTSAEQRRQLIDYLASLDADNPLCQSFSQP